MQDKKKLMVLGALGVVLIGVGAFTFMGGSEPPPAAPTAKKEAKQLAAEKAAEEEKEAVKNPMYASVLPQRDPFKESSLPGAFNPQQTTQPAPPKLPQATKQHRPNRGGGDTQLPPFQIDKGTGLPPAGGQIGLQPSGPDPLAFGYQVSGVIVGAHPAAVFTDSQGNQRLVSVGASLDGDSKVVAIDRGQVTVQHRGKTLRLTLGGTPHEK